jgi:hypothetical protein
MCGRLSIEQQSKLTWHIWPIWAQHLPFGKHSNPPQSAGDVQGSLGPF